MVMAGNLFFDSGAAGRGILDHEYSNIMSDGKSDRISWKPHESCDDKRGHPLFLFFFIPQIGELHTSVPRLRRNVYDQSIP